MVDFNLNLQQFLDISNGKYNAGQIDVSGDAQHGYKLTKINHHVELTFLNNKKLTPEKIVSIKQSFISALQKENLNQQAIDQIKKDLGLDTDSNSLDQNRTLVNRRYAPLTRQQIKEYIALARGEQLPVNPNKRIQDNVLKGTPVNLKTQSKAFMCLSYLSGINILDIPGMSANHLKFFAQQPKGLIKAHEMVENLIRRYNENPNAENLQEQFDLFTDNNKDKLTFKIIKDANNNPILCGICKIDNDEIPLNFGVSPQDYLSSVNSRLLDFMDVLPETKDSQGVSLGRTYLIKTLNDLAGTTSENQLNSMQNTHLRELSLAILKRNNPDLSANVDRLSTRTLCNMAVDHLRNSFSTEQLNQQVQNNITAMEQMMQNLVPGGNQNGRIPQQVPQDNNNQNVNAANPQNIEQINAEEEDINNDIEDDEDDIYGGIPKEQRYKAPKYDNEKPLVAFANQIFNIVGEPLGAENKPFNFEAFKTLLLNNADVLLAFAMGQINLFPYEENENGVAKQVAPKFDGAQFFDLYNQIMSDYTQASGKQFNLYGPSKDQVEDFKKFLRDTAQSQHFDKTIQLSLTEVTKNIITGQDIPKNAEAQNGEVKPFAELKFKGYTSAKDVNTFITTLTRLGKGNNLQNFKEFVIKNYDTFLTFLSGQFDDDAKIDAVHKEAYKQIRKDLCNMLKDLTGMETFAGKPDFTNLNQFETNKLLVRFNDNTLYETMMNAVSTAPMPLSSLKTMMMDDIKEAKEAHKNPKEEPVKTYVKHDKWNMVVEKKEELIGWTHGKYANEVGPQGVDLIPGKTWVVRKAIKDDAPERLVPSISNNPLPVATLLEADKNSLRQVTGAFITLLNKQGTKEEQRNNLTEFVTNNFPALIYAVSDKEFFKQCLLPQMQDIGDDIYELMRNTLDTLCSEIPVFGATGTKAFHVNNLSYGEYEKIYNHLKHYKLSDAVLDKAQENIGNKLPAIMKQTTTKFQTLINQVFKLDSKITATNSYDQKTPQQIKDELGKKSVDQILTDSRSGKTQSALMSFHLTVLKTYFEKLPVEETTQILETLLQTEPTVLNNGQPTIEDNKRMLRAMFKGAGPLFQKMLQGMNKDLADKNYGDLFDELKSNLNHIDKGYVANKVKEYLKKYERTFYSIEVGEPLGSATIAETFKCRIERRTKVDWNGTSKTEKTVVIKVMRPGIQKRAENEMKIFNEAAEQVPAVKEEWNTQVESIMKEFDFINESKNIDECEEVFEVKNNANSKDKHIAPDVETLHRDKDIPVQNDILATKLITGHTADKEVKELEDSVKDLFSNVFVLDPNSGLWKVDEKGNPVVKDGANIYDLTLARKSDYTIKNLFAFNKLLTQVTAKWIKEAVFNSGIIHNDVHGGNLMISGSSYDDTLRVTFIDFGNVEKISPQIQQKLQGLLAHTMHRDSAKFIETLSSMLTREATPEQKEKMTAIVEAIMSKGHSTEDAGFRLSAIMGELKNLGLAFPKELYNFINGLGRLQNFADNTSKLLKQTEVLYKALTAQTELVTKEPTEEQRKQSFDGGYFDDMTNASLKEINYKNTLEIADDVEKKLEDPDSEIRKTLPDKILKDAFEGNFSASDKFFADMVGRHFLFDYWLNDNHHYAIYDNFKHAVSDAKAQGITMDQIKAVMDSPKKTIPANLSAHKDLINRVIETFDAMHKRFVSSLKRGVYEVKMRIERDGFNAKLILNNTDDSGKVISNPFEENLVSVEKSIGSLLTEVNNFSMTNVKGPIVAANEIIDTSQSGTKPLVEVSINPQGHEHVEEKLAG